MPGADDAVLLLGRDEPSQASLSDEVRVGSTVRWVGLGLVTVALLLFGLSRWPKSTAEGAERPDAAAAEEAESPDPEPSASDASTTTDRAGSGSGQETTTSESPEEAPVIDGPLVGEATGLGVIVAETGSGSNLSVIDLDTGRSHPLGVRGQPIGLLGTRLVVQDRTLVGIVDLADPEAEPVELMEDNARWINSVSLSDETIWIASAGEDDDFTTIGFDVEGRQVDELGQDIFGFGIWPGTNADLFFNMAGGVYLRIGDGYRRVSRGLLWASGEELALVHECDDVLVCSSAWYRIDGWERLDYPVPELGGSPSSLVGGDRYLTAMDWNNGEATLFEVETGKVVGTYDVQLGNGPLPSDVPVSGDGRWLLDAVGDQVIELESGRAWPLGLQLSSAVTPLFIDLEASGLQR